MKLFYKIAFKAVIRAVLSPLTPTHTLSKPPFHFDNFRTGWLCYEAEKATNSVFLLCCLQNGGDDLQNRVGTPYTRASHRQQGLHPGDASLPPGELSSFYKGPSLLGPCANILQTFNVTKLVCSWQRCDWAQNCMSKAASQPSARIHLEGCMYVYTHSCICTCI